MVGEIAFLASNSSDINQLLYYDENDLICLNPWRPVQSREELRALLCCCSHLVDVGYLPYPWNLSKRYLSKRFFAAFVCVSNYALRSACWSHEEIKSVCKTSDPHSSLKMIENPENVTSYAGLQMYHCNRPGLPTTGRERIRTTSYTLPGKCISK